MSIQLHFYENFALGFSRSLQSNWHSHLALQLTLALQGDFQVLTSMPSCSLACGKSDENSECAHTPTGTDAIRSVSSEFACFAPKQPHCIPASTNELAYLYLECSPQGFQKWQARGGVPRAPEEKLRQALLSFRNRSSSDRDLALNLASQWREQSLPGLMSTAPTHSRIAAIIDHINVSPLADHNHVTLAQRANLSPSRFAHLFREHTGMPVRNYLLWRRLLFSLGRLQQGYSITATAYEAGFADGAHMSRSFRQVFGSSPTDLQVEQIARKGIDPALHHGFRGQSNWAADTA
jgi:AraC-like DNA-binding protein